MLDRMQWPTGKQFTVYGTYGIATRPVEEN